MTLRHTHTNLPRRGSVGAAMRRDHIVSVVSPVAHNTPGAMPRQHNTWKEHKQNTVRKLDGISHKQTVLGNTTFGHCINGYILG